MANCKQCGAPLAANTNQCQYCSTRNDIDLHAKFPYAIASIVSNRTCPQCKVPLQTIRSTTDKQLHIDRCNQCFSLFFDRDELEYALDKSVSNVFGINLEHIDNINKDRYQKPGDFSYRQCPECSVLMNRVNFGQRSAVVVDRCLTHGIWLDNGELSHLMEWKKAGGQILHQQTETLKTKNPSQSRTPLPDASPLAHSGQRENDSWGINWDIIAALGWLLAKVFFDR